jgi:antitoxin ChpS
MYSTNLRKVGGSIMLAVPPSILQVLGLATDAQVNLQVKDGKLIIEPKQKSEYSLNQLLQEQQQAGLMDDPWSDVKPAGRELL